jgi:glycosyltransferase involved in cell wall biosynthesis
MIHFFTKIGRDVRGFEFTKELQKICDVETRIFGCLIHFAYRHRIMFVAAWYPKLIYHSIRLAFRSLVIARPHPAVVVLESDVEVLIFAALGRFVWWRRPKIVYLTFIYTSRTSRAINYVRRLYYSLVLNKCARIFCHSRLEVERYSMIFPKSAHKFVFLPWGGNVGGWQSVRDHVGVPVPDRPLRVLSAGRSGRDYATLAQAVAGESFDVTVICDNQDALGGIRETANLRILRHCYDSDYFYQLRSCDIVVVPLAVQDISQGQMVVIQAMAYGKPLIVTRTPTICDYVIEGEEALMVSKGNVAELRAAMKRLQYDPELYTHLRLNARNGYRRRHSQPVVTRRLINALLDLCPQSGFASSVDQGEYEGTCL